jgi:hypothetical protein
MDEHDLRDHVHHVVVDPAIFTLNPRSYFHISILVLQEGKEVEVSGGRDECRW